MFARPQQVLYDVDVDLPAAGSYQYRMVSFSGNKYVLADVIDEVPSGDVNSSNTAFTLANIPLEGTVVIVADGETITDDGDGNLSDGGSIDYANKSITLDAAPAESVTVSYLKSAPDGVIVDDATVSEAGTEKMKVMFAGVLYVDMFEKPITEADKAMLRRVTVFIEPRLSVNY